MYLQLQLEYSLCKKQGEFMVDLAILPLETVSLLR